MTLVIGTDEAGYGPNLGPLAIAATAWRVDAAPEVVEQTLAAAVAAAMSQPLWGDSKAIYRAGAGFKALEQGALAAVCLANPRQPRDWSSLVAALGVTADEPPPEQSALLAVAVPQHEHAPALPDFAAGIGHRLVAAGVALLEVRARLLHPAAFNRLLDRGLNKSDILSATTLDLAASLADLAEAEEPVVIWCDRHGGRRRYAPQVSRAFATPLVSPLEETATSSRYAFGAGRQIEFSVRGEARTPVAVASMTAKYLRELAMLAFNTFWSERLPGLAPTAGYPVDALRWRHDTGPTVERAGIGWDAIWRRA